MLSGKNVGRIFLKKLRTTKDSVGKKYVKIRKVTRKEIKNRLLENSLYKS